MKPVKRAKVYRPQEEQPETYTGAVRLPREKVARRRMMKDRKL